MVTLTITTVAIGTLLSLSGNAATAQERWPGLLDLLRRYPWQSVGGATLLGLVTAVGLVLLEARPAVEANDPPAPPPATVEDWIIARNESSQAVAAVCGQHRAIGITTALEGAGGFGKTTLAETVCAHPRVRKHFRDRVYFVTIGRDLRSRAAIAAKVAEVTRFITGDTTAFDDPDLAGAHLGRLLDQRPRTLLVIDDVWRPEQLAPLISGGRRCVRLVTTRIPAVLPANARRIQVDEMSVNQARQMLVYGLPPLPEEVTRGLLRVSGRWPLLLRMINRLIAAEVATGVEADVASEDALERIREHGPAAMDDPSISLDLDDPKRRRMAVRATVEAATRLLPTGAYARFVELGVFAEDETVPLSLVATLWHATGSLTPTDTRNLCRALDELSLVALSSDAGGAISLHDVIRDYLRGELGAGRLTGLHTALVDGVEADLPLAPRLAHSAPQPALAWWELPDGYMFDHAVHHLLIVSE
ncbi:NB-ARC domain-containing protein [Streptomyces albidoflavus]|uniref:NB-ARC domain-containing protein n=2 Tax=Streptomyces TaxID=1883 RepID=UPI00331A2B37